jgi:hypothetical protein
VHCLVGTVAVAVGAAFTVSSKFAVAFAFAASITDTVCVFFATTAVGVPLTAPVAVLNVSPAGRGGVTAYVRGAVPPAPDTGVWAHACPTVHAFAGTATVAVSA